MADKTRRQLQSVGFHRRAYQHVHLKPGLLNAVTVNARNLAQHGCSRAEQRAWLAIADNYWHPLVTPGFEGWSLRRSLALSQALPPAEQRHLLDWIAADAEVRELHAASGGGEISEPLVEMDRPPTEPRSFATRCWRYLFD